MKFDYAAFKAGWQAGCEKYHIDPAAGPTSYTICNLRADQRKTAKARQYEDSAWAADREVRVEVHEALVAWLALGRWGWGVDLVEWGLIRDLLEFAVRLTKPREAPEGQSVEIDPDTVSVIDFYELWHEVREELRADLTPQQHERLPTWDEIRSGEKVTLPVPRALVMVS